MTREAHRLLKAAPLNFIGNVEGREIYSGVADVIVCDGFTGNVVLKTSEGLVETVEALLGDELQGTFSSQMGYLLSRRAFRRFRRRVDYSEFGGAPLLGVAGLAHRRPRTFVARRRCATRSRWPTGLPRAISFRASSSEIAGRDRCRIIDRVHISRAGFAEGRHGPGARPTPIPRLAPRSTKRMPRSRRPRCARLMLRGSRDELAADRERAARDSHREHRGVSRAGSARHRRRLRRRAQPRRVFGQRRCRDDSTLRDAVRMVRRRGRYMQEAVPVGGARWRRCSA